MTTRAAFAVLTTAFLVMAGASWAAVPQSLSYQGYLTDRIGSPITASQTITFSIYTVPVGGVPVWQETKSVAFSNGLFSTRLGEASAFPVDLFDVPLWLGMTIGTDSEMEPRRQLTTAGFSFRAEDADALQGRTAFELDQSLHVDDLGNPHQVSTGEIGAATQGELAIHTTATANPHLVTADQTGAVSDGVFTSHAINQSAHHQRYAAAEAVTAMGAQGASNPLNHDRYSDGESFAAVLAADGEGSGLDADVVDGLQAAEIIAAAGAMGRPQYEFVGFSTLTVNGAVGHLGLFQACEAAYGSESRMSNTDEILTKPLVPGTDVAWVRYSQVQSLGFFYDIPSNAFVDNFRFFHCDGWSTPSGGDRGLVVDSTNYTFRSLPCDVQRPVACSVPLITQ